MALREPGATGRTAADLAGKRKGRSSLIIPRTNQAGLGSIVANAGLSA